MVTEWYRDREQSAPSKRVKESLQVSAHKGMNPRWYAYPVEYSLAVNNKEVWSLVTAQMDLENTMLSEISQAEKMNTP